MSGRLQSEWVAGIVWNGWPRSAEYAVHIIGLIETYLPRYFNRAICTGIIYGSIIVPLLLGISTAAMVKRAILHHGYFHCEGGGTHMKLAHFEVYVREMDTCRQLTLERKKRKFIGMR